MLTIRTYPAGSGERGVRRRDALRAGTLALGGLTLTDVMRERAVASPSEGSTSFVRPNKSVVLLFLAGGPSQYETFDPKPEGFDSHTSIAGHLATKLPGVRFASYFPEMAARADRLTIVRSMVAKTANHAKAAKNLLTGGFEDPNGREGAPATFPSMGAAYAHARGATDSLTGMPSYAAVPPVFDKVDKLKISSVNPGVESVTLGSGGGTLGAAFAPFNPEGSSGWTDALTPRLPEFRLDARRDLLKELDTLNRRIETHSAFHDLDAVNQQACEALRGGAIRAALDLGREEPSVAATYDTSHFPIYGWNKGNFWETEGPRTGMPLGRQLLLARRLIEAGCRFVTVTHSNWDMHGGEAIWGMKDGMEVFGPPLDHAVSAFLDDTEQRGLADDVLLVIVGEFGRSGGINKVGGREHNANAASIVFAGGGLRHGQVVGETNRRGDRAARDVVTVDDLCATLMHYLFDVGKLRVTRTASAALRALAIDHGTPIPALF